MGHPADGEEITKEGVWKYALPQGCHLPGEMMWMIQMDLADKLQVQMSLEKIEAGYRETDPVAVARLRSISCRGCNQMTCSINPKSRALKSQTGLAGLCQGNLQTRRELGEQYLLSLLPEETRQTLRDQGVTVTVTQYPSRKKPCVVLSLRQGEETWRISATHLNRLEIMRDTPNFEYLTFSEAALAHTVREMVEHFTDQSAESDTTAHP